MRSTMTQKNKSITRASIEIQFGTRDKTLPAKKDIKAWAQKALERDIDVTIRIVDSEEGQILNKQFRGKKNPTNVLSFAYDSLCGKLGDIAICLPVVKSEAQKQDKTVAEHLAHLIILGMLHVQGFDHKEEAQAKKMEYQEIKLMKQLGFRNPY